MFDYFVSLFRINQWFPRVVFLDLPCVDAWNLTVTAAAISIFLYVWILPACIWTFLWWRNSHGSLKLSGALCLYGYSMFLYIPVSVSRMYRFLSRTNPKCSKSRLYFPSFSLLLIFDSFVSFIIPITVQFDSSNLGSFRDHKFSCTQEFYLAVSLADPHYMAPVALRFDGSYTFWHHSRIRLLEPSTVQPQWHGRPDSLGCISSPSRSGFWLCRVLLPLPSTKRRLYHSRN